jgi:hypothetical protein
VPLAFGRFAGQNMAVIRLLMFHPAAGRGLEALGRPPMGLHFGHDQILNSEIDISKIGTPPIFVTFPNLPSPTNAKNRRCPYFCYLGATLKIYQKNDACHNLTMTQNKKIQAPPWAAPE